MTTVGRGIAAVALSIVLLGAAACSGDDDSASGGTTTTTSTPPSTVARPDGPAADMSTELTGGNGVYLGEAVPPDLDALEYVQREYRADGTATSYTQQGERTSDGRWTFTPDGTAPYKTRVVVRAPKDESKFSGTVIVEWLNVSGGVDADPDWTSVEEEIARAGDAYVGVSAQKIGVDGGPVAVKVTGIEGAEDAGKGLKVIDPERYGDLEHPGDGYSFDIFTQVARAGRTGAGLDGWKPQHVLAAGESQSAFALVTYFNGVQPLTKAFDGFFIHSRGATGMPLVEPGKYNDIAGALGGQPTIFRTDDPTPIMDIQTETDVSSILNSLAARQDDTDTFRLWEVPGTAHADAHLVGPNASALDCGVPINDGPMHIVAKAALHALVDWVANGEAPPKAPRIDVQNGQVQRDADAIAKGGIRTPPVDVPVTALSGAPGPNPSTICLLLGSSKPLPAARIAQLYSSRDDYQQKFAADADQAIAAGFVLQADRDALLGFADPGAVAG
jgi:hypothetical protein